MLTRRSCFCLPRRRISPGGSVPLHLRKNGQQQIQLSSFGGGRRGGGSQFLSRLSSNQVLFAIIGANSLVYLAWNQSNSNYRLRAFMNNNFLLSSGGVWRDGRIHTLLTSMFSHQSLTHIGANMLTLYFFGSSAAAMLGARQFLSLYLGGGLFSSLCSVVWPKIVPDWCPASLKPSRYASVLGASGAVSSVVAWSILNNPSSIIYVYMIIPVPAAVFGVLYIGHEMWGLYNGGTGHANVAHLGGVAFGSFYYLRKAIRR